MDVPVLIGSWFEAGRSGSVLVAIRLRCAAGAWCHGLLAEFLNRCGLGDWRCGVFVADLLRWTTGEWRDGSVLRLGRGGTGNESQGAVPPVAVAGRSIVRQGCRLVLGRVLLSARWRVGRSCL